MIHRHCINWGTSSAPLHTSYGKPIRADTDLSWKWESDFDLILHIVSAHFASGTVMILCVETNSCIPTHPSAYQTDHTIWRAVLKLKNTEHFFQNLLWAFMMVRTPFEAQHPVQCRACVRLEPPRLVILGSSVVVVSSFVSWRWLEEPFLPMKQMLTWPRWFHHF